MNGKVIGSIAGVLTAFVLGTTSSLALAHGGYGRVPGMMGMGPGMMSGVGPMGMMGAPGMMGHMGMMGMGPGMMGGVGPMGMMGAPGMMGHMGMMGMAPVWMLDLSDEQRSKIDKIHNDLRKLHWDTMGKIMDESSKLHELFAADQPDAKKIGGVYGTIFDLRRQMIETGIDAHNRIDAVLTREQREQYKQIWRGYGPGYRGREMMGPGMGRGGMMGG